MLLATGDRPLSDAEWAELLELSASIRVDPPPGSLTYSPTTGLTVKQRKMLNDFAIARDKQLARYNALITDSLLVRGAIVPLSWLTPELEYRAFTSAKVEAAFAWLASKVSFDLPAARAVLEEMKRATRRG